MIKKILRFIPPLLVAGGALYGAMWFIELIKNGLVRELGPEALTYDMIPLIPGPLEADINWLLTWIAPIMIVEYFVLGIPVSALMLIISKFVKGASHDIDIIQTGNKFGARRLIQRIVIPALLALALGSIIQSYIAGLLINVPDPIPLEIIHFWNPLFSIVVGLIAVPIVMVIYIPTWFLNDAGITFHLKESQLEARRCPESIGVGRWWSNMLGGFTILVVPVYSFVQYFIIPYIVLGNVSAFEILRGFFFSFGVPILAIAFMLPIVIFNEMALGISRGWIRRVAKAVGAREMKLQTILTETEIVDKETDFGWSYSTTKKDE
ncbi:MAG: hypothetical protein JW779_12180 [Candidatus Thorarchaeota archaeon]|nr:hypothetical protein [Candidatus Thorarchaeota archaeon]